MSNPSALDAANWINGQRVTEGTRKESIDPATYNVIGTYPDDGLNAAKKSGCGCQSGIP